MRKTDERKRDVRQQIWTRRKKRIRIAVYAVLAAAVVLATLNFKRILTSLFWDMETFRVKEVHITPYNARELITGFMEMQTGGNMLFLDTDGLREQILRIREVEDCRVRKVYPSTIEIEVTLRRPWVVAEYAGRSFFVDRSGKILAPPEDSSGLLRVSGVTLGKEEVEGEDAWKLDVLKELEKWYNFNNLQKYFGVESVNIVKPTEIVLKTAGDSRRITTIRDYLQEKFEQLRVVLEECEKKGVQWEYIDLRFENPVVKYGEENVEINGAE
ncbi:MAG: FtsQ-type POTRA domain-containing protein [Candidatus Omnitrophica bacterium]|nr:FtsQ-type POTRA domain-containing protein [Candidatus Omnitrophota bacterium]